MKEKKAKQPKHLIFLAIVLWGLSALIAFLLIIPILDSMITIYAAFWADTDLFGQAYFMATTLRQISVLILAILFVIGIIGGAEHHARNFNTPASWHFLFITYAVELTLFLFTLFF